MLRWTLAAAAALFFVGCGDVDSDELETQTQVIDLRIGGETHSVSVDTVEDVDVIRTDGTRTSLVDWLEGLSTHLNVELEELIDSSDGAIMVVTDPYGGFDPAEAERRAQEERGVVATEDGQANCPEYCSHCPEEGAFVCEAMCSY